MGRREKKRAKNQQLSEQEDQFCLFIYIFISCLDTLENCALSLDCSEESILAFTLPLSQSCSHTPLTFVVKSRLY